jgi:hypothetical protein
LNVNNYLSREHKLILDLVINMKQKIIKIMWEEKIQNIINHLQLCKMMINNKSILKMINKINLDQMVALNLILVRIIHDSKYLLVNF